MLNDAGFNNYENEIKFYNILFAFSAVVIAFNNDVFSRTFNKQFFIIIVFSNIFAQRLSVILQIYLLTILSSCSTLKKKEICIVNWNSR